MNGVIDYANDATGSKLALGMQYKKIPRIFCGGFSALV